MIHWLTINNKYNNPSNPSSNPTLLSTSKLTIMFQSWSNDLDDLGVASGSLSGEVLEIEKSGACRTPGPQWQSVVTMDGSSYHRMTGRINIQQKTGSYTSYDLGYHPGGFWLIATKVHEVWYCRVSPVLPLRNFTIPHSKGSSDSWLWINTYENTIFRELFTSINPSYFDVNKKGVLLVLTHCQLASQKVHVFPVPSGKLT